MKPQACENCRNVEQLYWRRSHRVCLNCATLNPQWSRVPEARNRLPVDHPDFLNPVNQPNALGTSVSKAQACVHCGQYTYSRFVYHGAKGHKIIFACGWGHAGFWMDKKIEEDLLADGEAYVRESLGMETP